jgi:hypothetical protein
MRKNLLSTDLTHICNADVDVLSTAGLVAVDGEHDPVAGFKQ